jgi:hypothetical protein
MRIIMHTIAQVRKLVAPVKRAAMALATVNTVGLLLLILTGQYSWLFQPVPVLSL